MILVTGATGFIGSHLVPYLARQGRRIRAAVRDEHAALSPRDVDIVQVGDLAAGPDWSPALRGVDVVVHLAGRAHVVRDRGPDVENLYHQVNADTTRRLAEAARRAGVRRIVFMSSSKIFGDESPPGRAWREEDPPAPDDAYGRSKLAAERALQEVSLRGGIEVVVLRPPVVYGPGVRANIFELFRLVDRGVPLPVGGVHNRRSLVYVRNLVDAIVFAADAAFVAGQVLHVTDGEDVSSQDLVVRIGRALHRPPRVVPIPAMVLRLVGRTGDLVQQLAGVQVPLNSDNVVRLIGSAALDAGKVRALGWRPPATLEKGLEETAAWYRSQTHPGRT